MNAAQFSHALGKVNDKYIMEAITYERKKKSGWLKWGAMAACLCLVAGIAVTCPSPSLTFRLSMGMALSVSPRR